MAIIIPNGQAARVGTAMVNLNKVGKSFGRRGKKTVALDNINLTIREGEFVALLGASGSGKSTVLRIIAGLIAATDGEMLYRGKPLKGVNPATTIVFQTFALYPWLTVQENVEAALQPLGVPPEKRTERALALLDRVGLNGFEGAYPRELSGGMRQKVGFARAMAVEPELLCLDEPFSALDVLSAESLRGELMELWTSGNIPTKAILMVSHNIEEAVSMADRLIVMDKNPGRITAEFEVRLPYPRRKKDPAFLKLVDQVYAAITGKTLDDKTEMGSEPGAKVGSMRMLPLVPISQITGMVEQVAGDNGRVDVYQLARQVTLPTDELLPIIEAVELLGFGTLDSGDLTLTKLGLDFADADIQRRKEIFAEQSRRIPIMRWIEQMLTADKDNRVDRDVFMTALELDFNALDSYDQLETAIDWGRYGEIFSFDDDTDEVFLGTLNEEDPEKSDPQLHSID